VRLGVNYPLSQFGEFWTWNSRVVALTVTCPNCGMKAMAWFSNPPDGLPSPRTKGTWDRTGETLETLSLTPSFQMVGHFHSWIKNGELAVDSPYSCTKEMPA
jgi:hypothetical protein